MPRDRILILGGTRDARELADLLVANGCSVITSLAGVTQNPELPAGEVRRGGFGGAQGLLAYLRQESVVAVADATHPFAWRMSTNADAACREAGLPLLRLERAAWQATVDDRWLPVASVAEAAALLPERARAFITIGRNEIQAFLSREDISGLARMIEPPGITFSPRWSLLLDRPPFTVAHERMLMTDHAVTWLVTKNAGGPATEAKLIAARELRIPVIMVERPVKPPAQSFATAVELASTFQRLLSP